MILVYLIASYSALLVASVAGGAKIISVPFGMAASATVFSYALTFPITDVISEVYGERTARATVRSGFIGMLLAVLFFEVSIAAPPFAGWTLQESYVETLSQARRILIGGWTAFIVSQHLDVWVFHRIREATQGRHLWLRNLASTGTRPARGHRHLRGDCFLRHPTARGYNAWAVSREARYRRAGYGTRLLGS